MSKPDDSPAATPEAPTPAARKPTGPTASDADPPAKRSARADESGGPAWPEPTRYGDWERNGRVSDF